MISHRRRRSDRARLLALVTLLVLGPGRARADALYTVTNLGPLDVATGDDLTDSGEVVGNLGGPFGTPLLYQSYGPAAGTFTDLSGTLGGNVGVAGINDSGTVFTVGPYPYGYLPDPIPSATLAAFEQAAMAAGDRDAEALGINASGALVGMALVGTYPTAVLHAFLFQNGTLEDLNTMVSLPSSGYLEAATAINNNGQILVDELFPVPGGQEETLLLTPAGEPAPLAPPLAAVPEPGTLAFFALAAAGVGARRAWRRRRS